MIFEQNVTFHYPHFRPQSQWMFLTQILVRHNDSWSESGGEKGNNTVTLHYYNALLSLRWTRISWGSRLRGCRVRVHPRSIGGCFLSGARASASGAVQPVHDWEARPFEAIEFVSFLASRSKMYDAIGMKMRVHKTYTTEALNITTNVKYLSKLSLIYWRLFVKKT